MTRPLNPLEPHPRARKFLTQDQVRKIRRLREEGGRLRAIGAQFGISESAASRICSGHSYGPRPAGVPFRPAGRLTRQEAAQVVARRRAGETYPSLSKEFGVSLTTLYRVVRGEYRGWVQ